MTSLEAMQDKLLCDLIADAEKLERLHEQVKRDKGFYIRGGGDLLFEIHDQRELVIKRWKELVDV